jgi:hypothetical protein
MHGGQAAGKEGLMFNRFMSIVVAVSILHLMFAAPSFSSQKQHHKETEFAARIQAGILSLGTGEEAIVKLKLRDKTRLKGYISAAGSDSFTVTDPETGTSTQVAYPKVKEVKGNNLTKGTKISIGVLVGIGIVVMILLSAHFDDN